MIQQGKRYLVTGGSGFLGKELIARIISQGGIVRTIARNEGKLITMKEKFGDKLEIYFGDIKDKFAVEQFMVGEFEGLFHLAAFKHVPLAEKFSIECMQSNTVGSLNVLEVAAPKNMDFIIGISTDKAAQVAGVYGASKLLMEKAFQQYEAMYYDHTRTKFRIVRYGNVLYSTGSVLCKWKDLIEQGKGVTVTNRRATRFFWTLEQALDLIFECLEKATDSKPFVPTMKAMEINDLLKAMFIKYNREGVYIDITEIGLQPGENMHEKILEKGPYSNEVELYCIEEILDMV